MDSLPWCAQGAFALDWEGRANHGHESTPLQNFVFPNLPLPSYKRRDVAQLKMREFYVNILEKRRLSNEEVGRIPFLPPTELS